MTENCLISPTMELLGFTWVLRGNFTFINPMIPMSFKGQNQEVLLSGNKRVRRKSVIVLKISSHVNHT